MNRSILFALLASTTALGAPQIVKPVALDLPGGKGGIGFDDLMWSPALHRVLAPGGRTGKLDLIDPKTKAIESVEGFSADATFEGGHGEGTTSADSKAGTIAVGALSVLGSVAAAEDSHCVAVDDAAHAYVCDPKKGALLVVTDPFPATK